MHNIRKKKLKTKDKTKQDKTFDVYVDSFPSLRNPYAFVDPPW